MPVALPRYSAQIPIYGQGGVITDWSSGYRNPELARPRIGGYNGYNEANPAGAVGAAAQNYYNNLTAPAPAAGVAGASSATDDLSSWLAQNIPGYGGANVTAPPSLPAPSFQLPTYGQTSGGTSGGTSGISGRITTRPSFDYSSSTTTETTQSPAWEGMYPTLPAYSPLTPSDPRLDSLTDQSLKNIGSGLRGELPSDVRQQIARSAAERGLSVGTNSPNAGAAMLRALGLSSLDLQQAAEKNLQPYQERSAAVNLANIAQGGENWRALLDASQAMERLKLSESGQMARLSVQEKGDLERQILAGQQSLQQISAKGQTDVALALINADADQRRQILAGAQAMQQLQLSESGKIAQLSAQIKDGLRRQILEGQQALAKVNAEGANQRSNIALENQYAGQRQQEANKNSLDQIIARYKYPDNRIIQSNNGGAANPYNGGSVSMQGYDER